MIPKLSQSINARAGGWCMLVALLRFFHSVVGLREVAVMSKYSEFIEFRASQLVGLELD